MHPVPHRGWKPTGVPWYQGPGKGKMRFAWDQRNTSDTASLSNGIRMTHALSACI